MIVEISCERRSSYIFCARKYNWLSFTVTCSVAILVLDKFVIFWRSTKEVKMLYRTRFVVDVTENIKEGDVAAEVCSS